VEESDIIFASNNGDDGISRKIPYQQLLAIVASDPIVSESIFQAEAFLNIRVKQIEFTSRKKQVYPSMTEINGIPFTHTGKKMPNSPPPHDYPYVGSDPIFKIFDLDLKNGRWTTKLGIRRIFLSPLSKLMRQNRSGLALKLIPAPPTGCRIYRMGFPLNTVLKDEEGGCYGRIHFIASYFHPSRRTIKTSIGVTLNAVDQSYGILN
jgi:hypothetical protein